MVKKATILPSLITYSSLLLLTNDLLSDEDVLLVIFAYSKKGDKYGL
jgi:hypothetical protein